VCVCQGGGWWPSLFLSQIAWIDNLFSGAPEDEKALVTTYIRRYQEAVASMDKVVTLEKTVSSLEL
jgi:hypothetical protein